MAQQGDQGAWGGDPSYGQGYGQGYGPGPSGPPRNGVGVAALVLGILGLLLAIFLIGGLLGVVAVVLGIIGLRRASRGEATNRGVAIAGIVTGALAVVVAALVGILVGNVVSSDEFRDFTDCIDSGEPEEECRRQFEDDLQG